MSLIVVEGHTIETKEIFDIVESDYGYHGFIIRMIDKPDIKLIQRRNDNMFSCNLRDINDRYRKLMNEVKKQWEADKTELKTFKL